MSQPARKSAEFGDGAISYLEWPGAGAALNFAHANGFNAETYSSIFSPLAGEYHLFACDQRGHGFSRLPATPGLARNWTIFRDDLIAYLGRIADAPVILAGHSMGATASFMAAAAAPDRVRALLLFEPVLMAPVARQGTNPSPDLAERSLRRRDTFPTREAAFESWRGRGIFKGWPDRMVEDYVRGGLKPLSDGSWALACTPAWESECFRETPMHVSQLAPALRCPVTIVHGTINSTSFESEIAEIVRVRSDIRLVKVEGASHFLPMEYPGIVQEEIARMGQSLRI
jgi:pimeloyl-ACP methyl ester carboxylesterase